MTDIVLQGVSKSFSRKGEEFRALDNVSLNVEKGEVVVITGRSGSGKTTLLNIIGGLESASQGEVSVFGHDLRKMKEAALADFRRENVGFVFQAFHLIEEKSAAANVMLPLYFAGVPQSKAYERAIEYLTNVGLKDIADEPVGTFSAGQKQRTVLARSLINDPDVLLADEPTGNLDRENGEAVFDILIKYAQESNKTVLVATHDIEVLPDDLKRRIAIEKGKIEDES